MIVSELQLMIMLHIAVATISWPTVKLKILQYKYHIIEPALVNYNITEKSGEIIAYYEYKRDNLFIFLNVVIDFEDNSNEFSIEFMNTTINICKVLSNRRYAPLYGLLYAALQEKVPTLPKKCPIKKQILVIPLSSFETDKMPPIWPENAIRFTCRQYLYEKEILKPIMNFTLIYKLQRK